MNLLTNNRLREICDDVLEKLPKTIMNAMLLRVKIEDRERFELHEELICKYAKCSIDSLGNYTILLSIYALDKCSDIVVKGFIAHELAHPYCYFNAIKYNDDSDIDKIAINWGFSDEIYSMREVQPLS
jgi:hypothetical protein